MWKLFPLLSYTYAGVTVKRLYCSTNDQSSLTEWFSFTLMLECSHAYLSGFLDHQLWKFMLTEWFEQWMCEIYILVQKYTAPGWHIDRFTRVLYTCRLQKHVQVVHETTILRRWDFNACLPHNVWDSTSPHTHHALKVKRVNAVLTVNYMLNNAV